MTTQDKTAPGTTPDGRSWLTRIHDLNPLRSSYWALYGTIDDAPSRWLLAAGLGTAIAAGVPLPLIAVVFRGIIDSFPPAQDDLDRAVYQIVGISFAYFVVTFAWSVIWGELGRRISQRLQYRLVQKVLGLDQAFFDVDQLDITSLLVSDTQTIQRGTSEKVGLFLQSCSYFVATFVTGFILNAALTGVLFAAIVPMIILVTWTGSSLISKYSLKVSEFADQATSVAEGAIRCTVVVQAFGIADTLSDKHLQLLRYATRYAIRKVIVGAFMLALIFWACYSLDALAFFWGSRLDGSSGTIYAVVFLVLDASFVFNQVGPFIQTIALAAGASSKVFALLDEIESDISVYSERGIRVSHHNVSEDIHFDNVDFCYPSRSSSKVLHRLSLTIPGKRSTAIVGLSGSGKSTIVGLLLRLYDPLSGTVRIGSHAVRDLHLATFRSQIAVVQQSPVIFSGTILDNIRCGIVNHDDLEADEVRRRCLQAAKDAHCEFIDELKDGIDTFVSSSQGLSGGQRQRVCLARALVRKPSLLILDEPTSALDSWSEEKIEESLKQLMEQTTTTVITIAHRLSTIKGYSNIVVMGEGQVLEQGQHDELLETGIHYKALVEAQNLEQSVELGVEKMATEVGRLYSLPSAVKSTNSTLTNLDSRYSQHDIVSEGAKKRLSNRFVLAQCFKYVRPERSLLIAGISAAVVQGAVIIGEAIVFGHLIDILNTSIGRTSSYNQVDFYCLMFFVISLVAFAASAVSGICFGLVSEAFVLRMRDVLLRTILIQDQSWLQEPEHAATRLIACLNQNSNSLAAASGPILQTLFATSSMILSGVVLALISAPLITVVTLSYVPAILFSGYVRVKMLNLFNQRYSEANTNAAAIACEAVQNIETVAAFGLEKVLLQKHFTALNVSYWNNFVVMVIGDLALSFSYSVIYFLYPLIYWWGSQQVRNGLYTQQDFFITLPAVVIASQQCGQFFTMAPEITAARAAAQEIFQLLSNKPRIGRETLSPAPCGSSDRTNNQVAVLSSRPLSLSSPPNHLSSEKIRDGDTTREQGTILNRGVGVTFKDVGFSYPSRPDVKVLQSIDLQILPGQFVAFVGPSGAGKSSLVALLERFFDSTTGSVVVNGRDIRSIPIEKHRAQIGLVPQEPELFAGSIAFNISLGASPGESVGQVQIENVCRECGIHDFINSLPDGYGTECGSQGSKLSGGQKQRIAVARALVRRPRILLLDEATASLDSHSEKEIQQAVLKASVNRTTIVIAHRLSTIQHADCIFVLDNGLLVDQGTHNTLMQKDGIYKTMAQAQSL